MTTPAPEHPVFVRCRDGALYKNPVLVFREGFVTFVPECFAGELVSRCELVLWASEPPMDASAIAERILGRVFFLRDQRRVERVVPFSKPWEYKLADVVSVKLLGRIPRPTKHEGTERWPTRIRGAAVLEFPSEPGDAKRIVVE